ncbi:hypothetical protein SO802_008573 [Lithocarpus litseifolius]|uniref:Uncharacterized protein n=1 Tax=Lithocarpus litseifolius TaxID=425828 RepID=A0AAW2DEM6_9ROSI
MEGIILKYYSDLFQSSQPKEFAELIEAVVPKVSQEMNSSLTSEFQGVEVFKALKQMYPLKSPGPDVGRNKRITFNAVKEKLAKKLTGWKEKLLSKAGKEVLIKAVAQAIPAYTMSCFKIPDALYDELTSMIQNF